MESLIDLVFAYTTRHESPVHEDKVLVVNRRTKAQWRKARSTLKETACSKLVTKTRLMEWIKHLLANLHVVLGSKTYRQTKGVPMGTSCSPFLANLLLFTYEFEFVSETITSYPAARRPGSQQHTLLQKLSFCTRYIDDLWNPIVAKKDFQKILSSMYPDWLELGDPESEGSSVNYLDMTVWHDSGNWHSKLYDKRVQLVAKGLKLNKFPHPQSKLSSQ